jgi:hypothetical protein
LTGLDVQSQAVRIVESWGGTTRSGIDYNSRIVLGFADIAGANPEGQVNDSIRTLLTAIADAQARRSITVDLAGSGGAIENNAPIAITLRDEGLQTIRSTSAVVSGVGSSAVALALLGLDDVFETYDGSKDSVGVVATIASAMTFGTNGTGPRLLRYRSDYAQNNDIFGFSLADGTNRMIGANITGASAGSYVTSGASYSPRAYGGLFTRGLTTAGWTDTAPAVGEQQSPTQVQSRRASAVVATQTDAGLLSLGTGDVLAVGLGSIVGALTGAVTQDASGLTFALGSTTMTCRYLYLHHIKGS